nr:formin-like protein 11 [Ipomoea batatas]
MVMKYVESQPPPTETLKESSSKPEERPFTETSHLDFTLSVDLPAILDITPNIELLETKTLEDFHIEETFSKLLAAKAKKKGKSKVTIEDTYESYPKDPDSSATNRLITSKDHASVQINVGHLNENGVYDGKRVVTAVLISAGITSCLCAIGVLWGCQKFRTKRKNLIRALLVHCIEGETRGESSQKSVEKMINLSIPYAIHFHLIIPSGSPPPPPQPSQIPGPLGKDGTPLPKLKPLHWDKVRAAPECSTVWDKLKASSFEFDEEMIESLFGYSLQNPLKNEEVKCKSSSPSPSKHILEPKRIQNITILSKALNATSEQVCEALLNGSGLCLQELEALVKMAPAKEEEAKLLNYRGDTKKLASAERFVKAMLKVPFAFLRVEAMLFKETFEDEVFLLRRSFSTVEVGSLQGAEVEPAVPKTARSRTEDREQDEQWNTLSTELCNVKKAAALDLDALISCVSNLSGGIANTQNLLVLIKDDDEDKFVDAMRAFLKHAERSLKEVREDEHRALLGVRQITEYFHGDDVSKEESNNPLRIFVIVRDFLGMLDRV